MIEGGNFISVTEAAGRLGVTRTRVHQLIEGRSLPAQKVGHSYVIREADLALVANRATGRPKKAAEAKAVEATRTSAPVKAKKATNGAAAAKPIKQRTAKRGKR
jgi:excisionase family DNA binding protein